MLQPGDELPLKLQEGTASIANEQRRSVQKQSLPAPASPRQGRSSTLPVRALASERSAAHNPCLKSWKFA